MLSNIVLRVVHGKQGNIIDNFDLYLEDVEK
jgi:hypothetical protein